MPSCLHKYKYVDGKCQNMPFVIYQEKISERHPFVPLVCKSVVSHYIDRQYFYLHQETTYNVIGYLPCFRSRYFIRYNYIEAPYSPMLSHDCRVILFSIELTNFTF